QAAAVGGLTDQALELNEQRADFVQAAFGRAHNVAGAVGVVDRGADAGLLRLQILAGDQACRIIRTTVDLQTRAEAFEALVERLLILAQHALSDKRTDVGVNSGHCLSVTLTAPAAGFCARRHFGSRTRAGILTRSPFPFERLWSGGQGYPPAACSRAAPLKRLSSVSVDRASFP